MHASMFNAFRPPIFRVDFCGKCKPHPQYRLMFGYCIQMGIALVTVAVGWSHYDNKDEHEVEARIKAFCVGLLLFVCCDLAVFM